MVDLGVMTPCEKILQRAMEENAGKISMPQLICFFFNISGWINNYVSASQYHHIYKSKSSQVLGFKWTGNLCQHNVPVLMVTNSKAPLFACCRHHRFVGVDHALA